MKPTIPYMLTSPEQLLELCARAGEGWAVYASVRGRWSSLHDHVYVETSEERVVGLCHLPPGNAREWLMHERERLPPVFIGVCGEWRSLDEDLAAEAEERSKTTVTTPKEAAPSEVGPVLTADRQLRLPM